MFEQSRKRIFLYDRSKLGQVYCYNLCTTAQTDEEAKELLTLLGAPFTTNG